MTPRLFALAMGIVFIVIGIAGFIPALVAPPPATEVTGMGHGLLFGLFPINALHNIVHIAFGLWGVIAYRGMRSARFFAQATAVVYAVLAVMGVIPGLRTLYGLLPLHGNDIWLHAVIALVAAWFGFGRPARTQSV